MHYANAWFYFSGISPQWYAIFDRKNDFKKKLKTGFQNRKPDFGFQTESWISGFRLTSLIKNECFCPFVDVLTSSGTFCLTFSCARRTMSDSLSSLCQTFIHRWDLRFSRVMLTIIHRLDLPLFSGEIYCYSQVRFTIIHSLDLLLFTG